MSWPTARLAEVVQFLDSKRRPVKESERVEGPYPYYGANGQQGWIDDFIFDEPLILLAEDGGHFDNPSRGIAYAIEGKTWVNNHAHVLRATSRVHFRYLLHALKNRDVRSYITGSTRAKLTKDGASRIEIPLPPLEEQRRIAAILDQAEELRAKRRAAIALLDQLPQAIFLEMFGDPATNPMGWPVADLASLARQKPNNGIFKKNPDYLESRAIGTPVVWVEELFRPNPIDTTHSRKVVPTEAEVLKYGLDFGDLLFCRSSLKLDGIAFSNVFLGESKSAMFECHLIRISPDLTRINPLYLNQQLRLPSMRERVKARAKTATMTTIDQAGLGATIVAVPPVNLQSQFAKRLLTIQQAKAAHQSALAELDALFASLQAMAFEGDAQSVRELSHV